ncbi:MAG: hypothetical protein PHQ58_02420 [Rhodoferax sp.]|uniref:hypothetical protein n=1 Tax=Rhodoferax sp. TaxID=50421 RepID=UPI00260F17EF|nr:hypothetical protein [Rhodoferax sp.]MDD2879266.1 hypothetical protein [Rhodoferax sp.]
MAKTTHGGYRPGAGRPRGALNRRTVASNAAARSIPHCTDPLDFLLAVMRHDGIQMTVRLGAAKALLPYTEAPSRA